MSQTYPLMRGTAPLLVALISVLALGDRLSWLAWSGIGVICLSILAMAMNGRMQSRKGIWLALLNACFIAGIRWWTAPACGCRKPRWAIRCGPSL
jgi:drug/metabolite transporter (DMT)-like permease